MESVLITGSARRVGAMIAEDLASAGYKVWIHYCSHRTEAEALTQRIRNSGGEAECIRADLRLTDEIDEMLEKIRRDERSELTALINNASLFRRGTVADTTPDDWDRLMDTNLKAVWYLSTRAAKSFPSLRRIITLGDASVSNGFREHAVYGLSKYALRYLTEQMAAAFAPRVRVNLLSPGFVMKGENEPDEIWNGRNGRTLTDNSGIRHAVLNGIRFLMSDPGLDGSELMIDNGLHLNQKTDNMM